MRDHTGHHDAVIESAEEFVQLRTSDDPADHYRASRESASLTVWQAVIDRYPDMRYWVAHNKTVPLEVLEQLAHDSELRVRWMVRQRRSWTQAHPEDAERERRQRRQVQRLQVSREDRIPIDILVLLVCSIGLVWSVIEGNVGSTVTSALFALMGVSSVIRHHVRDRQRGSDPAQTGLRKALLTGLTLVGGLAFGTLCTFAAVRVTIDAVQASGGERIFYTVVAVVFSLLAALLIVGTVVQAVRPLPSNAVAHPSSPESSESHQEPPRPANTD